ncbi:MAG: ABC transporter substrate-binding protein [Candidatus Eisenbacteria bacterium]|nr:ABC transporter substrate-binding protein [Candidatus Eisenbacteria bacterium]
MPPQRVVSLVASGTEMVCALGCGDRLVARSHECDHPAWVRKLPAATRPKFALDGASKERHERALAPAAQGIPVCEVDAPALAALSPDLVLIRAQHEACAVSLAEVESALRTAAAPPVKLVALGPGSLADIWSDLRRVADALGVPERGVQQVARLRRRMEAVAERAGEMPRLRVACLEWLEPPTVAGRWMPELIAMAGGDDVFGAHDRAASPLAWDDLRAADPEVIFVAPRGFDLARTRPAMAALAARPGWGDLAAVRAGRVYLGDGNAYFNRPGPRVAETVEILAEALHPEAFRFGHEGVGWERWSGG